MKTMGGKSGEKVALPARRAIVSLCSCATRWLSLTSARRTTWIYRSTYVCRLVFSVQGIDEQIQVVAPEDC